MTRLAPCNWGRRGRDEASPPCRPVVTAIPVTNSILTERVPRSDMGTARGERACTTPQTSNTLISRETSRIAFLIIDSSSPLGLFHLQPRRYGTMVEQIAWSCHSPELAPYISIIMHTLTLPSIAYSRVTHNVISRVVQGEAQLGECTIEES